MLVFKIDNIKPLVSDELLNHGIYLHIVHATTAPPHLVLSINGKIFALSTKGPSIDGNMEQNLRFLRYKRVKTLFVKLKLPLLISSTDLLKKIRSIVTAYPRVDIGIATCLSPVKLFFEEVYNLSMKDLNYLFQLLPALYSEKLIECTASLFIDENDYQLPFYSDNEINAQIEQARTQSSKL